MWYYPIPELVSARHPTTHTPPKLTEPLRRKRRKLRQDPRDLPLVRHYAPEEKTDLISPAFLSFNVLTMQSPKARANRDLVRQYQKSRIPPAYEHLIEYNFVMASPNYTEPEKWAMLEEEQDEYGDLVILDEMEVDDEKRMQENGDFGKTYRTWQELMARADDGRGRSAVWYL